MKTKITLLLALVLSSLFISAQTVMNIHQGNGTILQLPLNTIDSITYTISNQGNLAMLTTLPIGNITTSGATSGGNITNNGGSTITSRGIVWGTSTNPTTADNSSVNGSGTGSFTSNLSGLTGGTTYYVKAYAINSAGTSYGNEVSFTTTSSSPFSILDSLNLYENVNFSSGESVAFEMEISKKTDWEIEIVGVSTGAKRKFTGNDRIISINNAIWKGGADVFPSFGLEKSYITIRFPNEQDAPIISDSITITGLKSDNGNVITSFENGFQNHWDLFNQTTVSGSINCSDSKAAKGNCYYKWSGFVPWDWAIGSVQIKAPNSGFSLSPNANNLFFNMAAKMVENTGTNNCVFQLWFDEDDNGDGVFDENTEDRFIYEYWYENDEWNLISFKYSDLKYDANGDLLVVKGNGLPEPSKLISINVFFLANKEYGIKSEAYADHIIFTENESYKP